MAQTITQTQQAPQQHRLKIPLAQYPKLSREQAGHLRHFHNLASQKDGEWRHMGTQEPAQEFLDAYRYQLATMAYASSVAHYHRLPALHSVFKTLHRRLIYKMLRREVWGYWFNTSMSGRMVDPDIKELRKPWANPVVRENIMYSGHLLLMASLYGMLYDDDEFEKEGGLTFNWDPIFWGMGPESFAYTTLTLQDAIMNEMERTGYLGVCCEPNMVFVICNQFPIIAVRHNDVRHNTNVIDDLLRKYKAAWDKKGGFVASNGQFYTAWMEKQDKLTPVWPGCSSTAWASAYMNTWNSDTVKAAYSGAIVGSINNTDDPNGPTLHPPPVTEAIRKLVREEDADPNSKATLDRAKTLVRENMKSAPTPKLLIQKLTTPEFGYVVQWLSELGKDTELRGLLRYADTRLNPSWENGGLYYPRSDTVMNENLEWMHMDPFTGNASIGYARLNVPDGQKKMYEAPWTSETLKSRPFVDGVELGDGVDFLRGVWDEGNSCLVTTMRTWDDRKCRVKPVLRNLRAGVWKVYVNQYCVMEKQVGAGGCIEVSVEVGGEEVDLVAVREQWTVSVDA